MLKEKNPVLKLKIKIENSTSVNKIFESLYSFYHFILNEPIEIFFFRFFKYSLKLSPIDCFYI